MKQQSANDWASTDHSKNISLADAKAFCDHTAKALLLQFGPLRVMTSAGETISESELRQNQFISPLPVNLFGSVVGGVQDVNIATFRTALRAAADADDPTTALLTASQLPVSYLSRWPSVQAVVQEALSSIA